MHIAHAVLHDADPHVETSEPWAATDGTVMPPSLNVWPLGQGKLDVHWSMSLEEATALANALLNGVEQARQLFPG